jgi:hypothetical protein
MARSAWAGRALPCRFPSGDQIEQRRIQKVEDMAETLEKMSFDGTISRGDSVYDVTFDVHAEEDFHLHIMIDPISTATYLGLSAAMGQPGTLCEDLTLQGKADNGTIFSSDTVYLRGTSHGETAKIAVGTRKATVTMIRDKAVERPIMRLWMRSFKSWNNPVVEMSLGQVEVKGATQTTSVEEVSGSVAVQPTAATDLEDWASRADSFLTYMMRGLAFAHGSRLQTPRCDLYIENRSEITFYEGTASPPGFPNVPSLDHGAFIKALSSRYDSLPALSDMVWTAVGWSQLDTTADQGRFISCMTALETVVEHLVPAGQTTVVQKIQFNPVRDQVVACISASEISDEAKAIFIGKIKGLNSRSLSQKIQALRAHYGLPEDKYDDSSIVAVIKLRNDVVHTGAPDKNELWPRILFVRELIADIVFSELRYVGVRESYLGGYKLVHPDPAELGGTEAAGADISVE